MRGEKESMSEVIIYSDGGSRGNPGPAGIGAVIIEKREKIHLRQGYGGQVKEKRDEVIHEISEYIGEATNNQAEYRALVAALKWVKENIKEISGIQCFLDSELVVKQLNGHYKMKNSGLKELFWEIRDLILEFQGKINFHYIARAQNKQADKLVNLAIDRGL